MHVQIALFPDASGIVRGGMISTKVFGAFYGQPAFGAKHPASYPPESGRTLALPALAPDGESELRAPLAAA